MYVFGCSHTHNQRHYESARFSEKMQARQSHRGIAAIADERFIYQERKAQAAGQTHYQSGDEKYCGIMRQDAYHMNCDGKTDA